MGTEIKIIAFQNEGKKKKWDEFKVKFGEKFQIDCDETTWIECSCHHCSYSYADLDVISKDFEEFKGSGIELNLYYLEQDPDQTRNL
jgi:hypothetical protein